MSTLRLRRHIALVTIALLAISSLAVPVNAGNTRDVYFGSPGALVSGLLSPLNSVTAGGAIAVPLRLENKGGQTLNKVSFIGGALADDAAYNDLFPAPTYPSLDDDLSFLAVYPLGGAPDCAVVLADRIQCVVGTLASLDYVEYLIVISTSSAASGDQPFWLTASWNEGWSTTGSNADYAFAEGTVSVGTADCSQAASYFLDDAPINLSNTGFGVCVQQTTISTDPVGGVGTFASITVGGQTSCAAVGVTCFGDDSTVSVYGGNPVGDGIEWTVRWEPLPINGKPKGIVHFLDGYDPVSNPSAYTVIPFSGKGHCATPTSVDCWTSIESTKAYYQVTFRTLTNGGVRGF